MSMEIVQIMIFCLLLFDMYIHMYLFLVVSSFFACACFIIITKIEFNRNFIMPQQRKRVIIIVVVVIGLNL